MAITSQLAMPSTRTPASENPPKIIRPFPKEPTEHKMETGGHKWAVCRLVRSALVALDKDIAAAVIHIVLGGTSQPSPLRGDDGLRENRSAAAVPMRASLPGGLALQCR